MKIAYLVSLLALSSLSLGGCIEEGHSADCSAGGRGNLEDEGCVTPIGGSCLTEEEFKAGRPGKRETSSGREITVDEDWDAYQCERPQCGECLTTEEFAALDCEELDRDDYLDVRPECSP